MEMCVSRSRLSEVNVWGLELEAVHIHHLRGCLLDCEQSRATGDNLHAALQLCAALEWCSKCSVVGYPSFPGQPCSHVPAAAAS